MAGQVRQRNQEEKGRQIRKAQTNWYITFQKSEKQSKIHRRGKPLPICVSKALKETASIITSKETIEIEIKHKVKHEIEYEEGQEGKEFLR